MNWKELLKDKIQIEKINDIINQMDKLKNNPAHIHFSETLNSLPQINMEIKDFSTDTIKLDTKNSYDKKLLHHCLKELGPWKKGPFQIGENLIDAEWRSDFKWKRLKNSISSLEEKKVLDIGCNNGYFMFRMLEQRPEFVLGIDPVLPCWAQFSALNKYADQKNLFFELLGVDDLQYFGECFDTVFSMGIIYHHRNPIGQLIQLRNILSPGGELILETIGIPGDDHSCLFPQDRYAKMKNVWFLPTLPTLINWLERTKFTDIEIISTEYESIKEQRKTEWSGDVSLANFLNSDKTKTIEGYPAPLRFCLKAKKKERN
ncbi:MAG: tRNA 5-methoxyuridine(34)/uridine 5-oxyacetic acid(34) synthase CmoB [Halobacteriovoraceae bacterium]|nr:tRNA 5-methoxyuridine(34)/uridine 5-oxyacetic acid(34) synthase CmoB [Halobacteriovoraceae bacterium]